MPQKLGAGSQPGSFLLLFPGILCKIYKKRKKEKKMKKDTFAMVAGGVVALMAILAFAMVAAIR